MRAATWCTAFLATFLLACAPQDRILLGARLECRLYPVENASPGGVTKDDLLKFSVLFELGSDQAYLVDSDTSVGATTTRIPDAVVLKIPEDPGSLTIRSDGMATWVRLYPVEDIVRSMEFTGRCTKP